MRTNGELSTLIIEHAKVYWREKLEGAITFLQFATINEEVARKILEPFLRETVIGLPLELQKRLFRSLDEYVPDAAASIERSRHMNRLDTISEKGLVCLITAEALLIDFINFAYLPGDLGFSYKYLEEPVVMAC